MHHIRASTKTIYLLQCRKGGFEVISILVPWWLIRFCMHKPIICVILNVKLCFTSLKFNRKISCKQ